MNVVGGYSAYSLYPYLTFHKRRAVLLSQNKNSLPSWVAVGIDTLLQRRGWDGIEGYQVEQATGSVPGELAQGRRFCGDNRSFVVEFELEIMQECKAFPKVRMNSWNLVLRPEAPSRTWFITEGVETEEHHTVGLNTLDAFTDMDFLYYRHAEF